MEVTFKPMTTKARTLLFQLAILKVGDISLPWQFFAYIDAILNFLKDYGNINKFITIFTKAYTLISSPGTQWG